MATLKPAIMFAPTPPDMAKLDDLISHATANGRSMHKLNGSMCPTYVLRYAIELAHASIFSASSAGGAGRKRSRTTHKGKS